jgi:hypothetical protein
MEIDNKDGQIANFFWVDGQFVMDYACFGDAISFDSTFQTNKFEMHFAPIPGTNHHKQIIFFGTALIFNETIESFVWHLLGLRPQQERREGKKERELVGPNGQVSPPPSPWALFIGEVERVVYILFHWYGEIL